MFDFGFILSVKLLAFTEKLLFFISFSIQTTFCYNCFFVLDHFSPVAPADALLNDLPAWCPATCTPRRLGCTYGARSSTPSIWRGSFIRLTGLIQTGINPRKYARLQEARSRCSQLRKDVTAAGGGSVQKGSPVVKCHTSLRSILGGFKRRLGRR